MTVLKAKRGVSSMEFIKNARDLEIYTIRKVANFPKRYTFYVSQPIANTATEIHKNVKMANSVYPTNQHEVQTRRDLFQLALAQVQALISQVEVAAELFPIEPNAIEYWMGLVYKEDQLIRAILKSDWQRYKSLPDFYD